MQIREERQGDAQIVTIDDHLDTNAAPVLEESLMRLIDAGARRVVLDCAALQYVNSAGLKVLLLAAKRIDPLGGQLVVCSLAPNVQAVFEMIGFDRVLKIAATREEAVQAFDAAPAAP